MTGERIYLQTGEGGSGGLSKKEIEEAIAKGEIGLPTALMRTANDLSDVADAGSSRANIHVPVLTPVLVVSTANIASLTGHPTIDGETITEGIVLLAGQTTTSQNGLWEVPAVSGAWVRPTEFATGLVVKARTVVVLAGTLHTRSEWLLTVTGSVTVGTTAQTWEEVTGSFLTRIPSAEVTSAGTLTANQITKVKLGATGKMKVPSASATNYGKLIIVENASSASAPFPLTVEGPIRGSGTVKIVLAVGGELLALLADASGFWWPLGELTQKMQRREASTELTAGELNEVTGAGGGTNALPEGAKSFGKQLAVVNETAGTVTIEGEIGGASVTTFVLANAGQTVLFLCDQDGIWWPIGEVGLAAAAEAKAKAEVAAAEAKAKAEVEAAAEAAAPLASPSLTGTPKAPTATAGTNTTQIATTAFVHTAKGEVESAAGLGPTTATYFKAEAEADSPSMYLRLADAEYGESATAADVTGKNNGVYHGTGVVRVPGALTLAGDTNGAAEFPASSDYVEVANSSYLELTGNVTVEAWVKQGTVGAGTILSRPGYALVVESGPVGGNNLSITLHFRTHAGVATTSKQKSGGIGSGHFTLEGIPKATCEKILVGMAAFGAGIQGGATVTEVKASEEKVVLSLETEGYTSSEPSYFTSEANAHFKLYPERWYHVVGVATGTEVRLYINGVLMSARPGITGENTKAPLYIGRAESGSTWKGAIDEVLLYNTALSAERIRSHYEAGHPPNTNPGVVPYEVGTVLPTTSAYAAIVKRDGPTMYHRYNEPTGALVARDSVGRCPGEFGETSAGLLKLRAGALIAGDPTASSVRLKGNASELGTGGFISVLNRTPLQFSTALTIELWVEMVEETGGSGGQQQLVSLTEESFGFEGYWCSISSELISGSPEGKKGYGYVEFGVPELGDYNGPLTYTASNYFTAGKPGYLVITYNGSTQAAKIYINGSEVTTKNVGTMPTSIKYTGAPPGISALPAAGFGSQAEWKFGSLAANVRMAELALYGKVLGATEIKEHAEVGKGEKE